MEAVQTQEIETINITQETDSVGRPCKYESHIQPFLKDIKKWIEEGYTDYSIADSLGIHYNTFSRYKGIFKELSDLYTRTQVKNDKLVFNAMLRKATGIKEKIKKQKVLNDGSVIEFEEEVYIPPCHNAADVYERNHNPEYRGAKQEITNTHNINVSMSLEDIDAQIKRLDAALNRDAIEGEIIEISS